MYERKIRYTTVSISENLMNEIKEHITTYKRNISAGDFVREAIKEKIKTQKLYDREWKKRTETPLGVINMLRLDPAWAKDIFESGEETFKELFPTINFDDVFHKEGNLKDSGLRTVEERLTELEENILQIIGMLDVLMEDKEKKKK